MRRAKSEGCWRSFPAIFPGWEGIPRITMCVEGAIEEEFPGDFGGDRNLAGNGEETVEQLENDAEVPEGLVGDDGGGVARQRERVLGRKENGRTDGAEKRERR